MDLENELERARIAVARKPNNMALRRDFLQVLKQSKLFPEYAIYLERALRKKEPVFNVKEANAQDYDEENEQKYGSTWAGFGSLPKKVRLDYRRGFVEHIILPSDFINDIPAMISRAPIKHLTVLQSPKSEALTSLPSECTGLYSVALRAHKLSDEFFENELCGRSWPNMRWLDLSYSTVSEENGLLLARATKKNFPCLTYVGLDGCSYNPIEKVYSDWGAIAYADPSGGAFLSKERAANSIPWMYRTKRLPNGRIGLVETNRYALADEE